MMINNAFEDSLKKGAMKILKSMIDKEHLKAERVGKMTTFTGRLSDMPP